MHAKSISAVYVSRLTANWRLASFITACRVSRAAQHALRASAKLPCSDCPTAWPPARQNATLLIRTQRAGPFELHSRVIQQHAAARRSSRKFSSDAALPAIRTKANRRSGRECESWSGWNGCQIIEERMSEGSRDRRARCRGRDDDVTISQCRSRITSGESNCVRFNCRKCAGKA